MLFMKMIFSGIVMAIVMACSRKESPQSYNAEVKIISERGIIAGLPKQESPKLSRVLRESIYFSASLEREALKLIIKNETAARKTLFSVLSYIVENYSGSKKSPPVGLDCAKFDVQYVSQRWVISKSCMKPQIEVAVVKTIRDGAEYEVEFTTSQWASVLGMSAVITGNNVICRMTILEEKLNTLSCVNWIHQVSEDQISSTVVKADEFIFNRNATKQFVIKGGFYKELVQNKKINIEIPLKGKIKIIEKELKVIDEFSAYKDGVTDESKKQENEYEVEKNKSESKSSEKDTKNQSESQIEDQVSDPVNEGQQSEETKVESEQQLDPPRRGR